MKHWAPGHTEFAPVVALLQDYFDGLYHSDTRILQRVFHSAAMYACATDGTLRALGMDEYFSIIDKRPSPASRGDSREDHILAIDFAGPVTALARVECTIYPKHFIDLLTLIKLEGRWQIIAKVFHFVLVDGGALV